MRPPAPPSGWLLGASAQFDALTDVADLVIARLAKAATEGDPKAAAEIVEVRRQVREVDGRDEASITALSSALSERAAELSP
jgi:hypothetical protein